MKKVAVKTAKTSMDKVFGIWKGRKISLAKIREKAWGRKTKSKFYDEHLFV